MEWVIIAVLFLVFLAINRSSNAALSSRFRTEIRQLEQKIDGLARQVEINNGRDRSALTSDYGRNPAGEIPPTEPPNPWDSREPFVQPEYTGFGQSLNQPGGPVSSRVGVQANFNNGGQPSGQYTLTPEVEALVRQGQKIQAIKLVREQTNMGLKDAKDLVEVYERQLKQGY